MRLATRYKATKSVQGTTSLCTSHLSERISAESLSIEFWSKQESLIARWPPQWPVFLSLIRLGHVEIYKIYINTGWIWNYIYEHIITIIKNEGLIFTMICIQCSAYQATNVFTSFFSVNMTETPCMCVVIVLSSLVGRTLFDPSPRLQLSDYNSLAAI